MSIPVQTMFALLSGYVLAPALLTWGWIRWLRQTRLQTVLAFPSLLGFILASASALIAVLALAFSVKRGGFAYYDPIVLKIFGIGSLLSLSGIILGVRGVWRVSCLRWHAPILAIVTLAFWIAAAGGELSIFLSRNFFASR